MYLCTLFSDTNLTRCNKSLRAETGRSFSIMENILGFPNCSNLLIRIFTFLILNTL